MSQSELFYTKQIDLVLFLVVFIRLSSFSLVPLLVKNCFRSPALKGLKRGLVRGEAKDVSALPREVPVEEARGVDLRS